MGPGFVQRPFTPRTFISGTKALMRSAIEGEGFLSTIPGDAEKQWYRVMIGFGHFISGTTGAMKTLSLMMVAVSSSTLNKVAGITFFIVVLSTA